MLVGRDTEIGLLEAARITATRERLLMLFAKLLEELSVALLKLLAFGSHTVVMLL